MRTNKSWGINRSTDSGHGRAMIGIPVSVLAEYKGMQMCTEAYLSCTIWAMSKAYITQSTKILDVQKFPG
jgi:hypothetical protein